jgi:hypothetical protein
MAGRLPADFLHAALETIKSGYLRAIRCPLVADSVEKDRQ